MTYEPDQEEDFYYTEPLPGGGHVHILKLAGREVILMYRRKFYRPYNETPMEGNPMLTKNTVLKKKLLEFAVGAPFVFAIGLLMKAEKKAVDRANAHYFPEDEVPAKKQDN